MGRGRREGGGERVGRGCGGEREGGGERGGWGGEGGEGGEGGGGRWEVGMTVIHILIGIFNSNPMITQYLDNNLT